jgi:hypothetical protein
LANDDVASPNPYDTVVVVGGLVSIGIAAVYWVMRIGFDDPIVPALKPVALALFIFVFPATVNAVLVRKPAKDSSERVRWWLSYPFLWLSALALTAALGRLEAATRLNAFPLVAAAGVVSFAIVFVRWLPLSSAWRTLVLIGGCAAFSIWASGVVWGRTYKNPLFYENFILDGRIHHDSLALMAIANMLKTYHTASTGIDGLNYIPYHWGTQWLFGQWANLLGADVLDFYQRGFAVTMIPFFFGGTLAFAVATRKLRNGPDANDDLRNDLRFWFIFLAACVGIIPLSGLDAMGAWTSNLLISESYTVVVPCGLLLLATVLIFYSSASSREGVQPSRAQSLANSLFVLIGIPLGIVLLGFLKISLMLLAFALAIYALFRLRLYRRPLYATSAIVTTIVVYLTYGMVALPAHQEGLHAFDFLKGYVPPQWWVFFVVVQIFWSWLYILLRLRAEGIGTIADIREAASERRILDVEAVALVAILGLGPGLILHIDGGSAFYFSDVQRWLAVGFILSRIPELYRAAFGEAQPTPAKRPRKLTARLDNISVRSVVFAFLLLPVIGSMISNAVVWPIAMLRLNAETRHDLYPPLLAAEIPEGLHGLPRLADHSVLDEGLRRSRNFVVADALRRLSVMPDSSRRLTALFIPQDQAEYWTSLRGERDCTFESFVAPALASLAMIDGMPPYGCRLSRYYGIGAFSPRTRPQLPEDSTPATLCRRAASLGVDRVIVLTFDNSRTAIERTIQCPDRQ